jgi:hypothetical protein
MKLSTILGTTLVIILTFIGASMLWFSASTVHARLSIDIQGVIVSRTSLISPFNGNEFTEYYIQQVDGTPLVYQANETDYSLPRDMPAGAFLSKHKWSLDYSVGGTERDDFPKVFYSVVGLTGLLLAGGSVWFSADYVVKERNKPRTVMPISDYPPLAGK